MKERREKARMEKKKRICRLNLFPPNVPMWEHDLKDNFLGFSFEQFFSKLVPHLEQMFSPLSVKKYNF